METAGIISLLLALFVILIGFNMISDKTKKLKLEERLNSSETEELQAILEESQTSNTLYGKFYRSYLKPQFDRNPSLMGKTANRFGVNLNGLDRKLKTTKMDKKISKEEFISLKLLGFIGLVIFLVLGFIAGNPSFILIAIMCYLLGCFCPQFMLDQNMRKRQDTIEEELPDFLDLVKSVTEAGMGIQEAIIKVTQKTSSVLSDEFALVMAETKSTGESWAKAMENMAVRNNIDSLYNVISNILISYERGTPITEVLEKEADAMRHLKNSKNQEKAKSLSIKLLIPIAFFSFIPMLVLLLAPMLIQLFESL
ncbi:MAG: type II secretion system F family protein [Candidatus Methanomethylophilus sp.]|nr:type II secretion system F family protein [Methanomethylophilus sp.]